MPWAVFELTNWGEKEDTVKLEQEIESNLGSVEVFIPFIKDEKGLDLSLVKGYIFIEISTVPPHKLFKLENTKYIKYLLTENQITETGTQRRISPVDDVYVHDLKTKFKSVLVSNLKRKDKVYIRSGLYKDLPATIIDIENHVASVIIELKSLKILIDIPTFNLSKTK